MSPIGISAFVFEKLSFDGDVILIDEMAIWDLLWREKWARRRMTGRLSKNRGFSGQLTWLEHTRYDQIISLAHPSCENFSQNPQITVSPLLTIYVYSSTMLAVQRKRQGEPANGNYSY
jgi:hypothetical protein